jgi:hypothetical protein
MKRFVILILPLLLPILSVAQKPEQKLHSLKKAMNDISFVAPDIEANNSFSKYVLKLESSLSNGEWNEEEFKKLQREILLSNPVLPEKLVFISRKQYKKDHHNTATLFQTGEINTNSFDPGAELNILNLKTGNLKSLLNTDEGVVRDPEVSFDGKTIIFSYRKNINDDYHIYEINADGTGLKQLTFAPGVSDIDPLYLPDGGILFSSTREPKYCMCNRHIMANLYSMTGDGANITQLGKSTLFEGHSALMPDGRIIYDRWEYIDRNFGDAQGLWTMNPDGTKHAIYYGNNTNSPGGIIDPRAVPGTNLSLCIFSSCHDRPWGALALIDRSKGIDGKKGLVQIWPGKAVDLIGKGNWDAFMVLNVRYEDPFPLNDRYFLCSKSIHLDKKRNNHSKEEKMGIFLVDIFGNELLLHKGDLSCFDPMPLTSKAKPPVIPIKRKFDDTPGTYYVQNVYEGTHMEGVDQGSVKFLRVVESPEKRTYTKENWNGQGAQAPGVNWHSFEVKKVLGTVPVEEDGSAHFEVPPGKYVYFQLLDKNKKMIQSMRSGVMAHPGETNGCIGCHEDRLSVPAGINRFPKALQRKPDEMKGWKGQTKTFSYIRDVQPIFDKHCVKCHDFDKKAGKNLILAGDRNMFFNGSYIDIYVKKQINCVGGGRAEIQSAGSWGSSVSNLVKVIENGHKNVELSIDEMETIYTWIDLNGVYYPQYESAYPDNMAGRSPLTFKELGELSKLTKVNFDKLRGHTRNLGPMISFERPDKSPCLKGLKKNKYNKALQIIETGQKRLIETPRADMDGFVPHTSMLEQLRKYDERKEIEKKYNRAISEGKKLKLEKQSEAEFTNSKDEQHHE